MLNLSLFLLKCLHNMSLYRSGDLKLSMESADTHSGSLLQRMAKSKWPDWFTISRMGAIRFERKPLEDVQMS